MWNFLSKTFRVFFYFFQRVGAGLGLPGHLALLALVEAWRSEGDGLGGRRGASQPVLQRGPLSPDVLLLVVPAVTVLTVRPCAVWCLVFFPLTLNKKCDRAGGLFSSPSGDRAGVRRKGEET